MSKRQRHSYIAFYPSDWQSGTFRLPRIHRSVYFDLCCYMWEFAEPVPKPVVDMILVDVEDPVSVLGLLASIGKVEVSADGAVSNRKALEEGRKAYDLWAKMSHGGKVGAQTRGTGKGSRKQAPLEAPLEGVNQENLERRPKSPANAGHSVADATGGEPPGLGLNGGSAVLPDYATFGNKADWFFHPSVISFVCSGGAPDRNARSMIGKLRSSLGDPSAAKRIMEGVETKVSDPISFLQAKIPKAKAQTGVNRRTFDDVDYGPGGKL